MRCFHFDLTPYRLTVKLIEKRMLFCRYQTLCSTNLVAYRMAATIQIY